MHPCIRTDPCVCMSVDWCGCICGWGWWGVNVFVFIFACPCKYWCGCGCAGLDVDVCTCALFTCVCIHASVREYMRLQLYENESREVTQGRKRCSVADRCFTNGVRCSLQKKEILVNGYIHAA